MLGRGLADLIPVGGSVAALDPLTGGPTPPTEIPVAQIRPNPRQPRTHFDEDALDELSRSIAQNGILQPILVRPRTPAGYEIVAGERRFRAALKAGLKQVPVVVRALTDEETLALALIENLIREDIGPLETARAFQRLMDDFGWTQEEMGKRVGKSRVAVTNSLRLLHLPDNVQRSLEGGEISEGHARALLGDEKSRATPAFRERQQRVWRQAVEKKLSVREVERLMRDAAAEAAGSPAVAPRPARPDSLGGSSVSRETRAGGDEEPDVLTFSDPVPAGMPLAELRALEDRLRDALGTKVQLLGDGSRGRIVVEYYSSEELDGLLATFEGRSATAEESEAG